MEPDEAQRRVHFRKGRNKCFFRIENGQHGMVFSLWVHLQPGRVSSMLKTQTEKSEVHFSFAD